MPSRGIRGATTVTENTVSAVEEATIELLKTILKKNSVDIESISHVIFTLTKDLNAVFPAKFAREELGWDAVPMMCVNEADVEGSLTFCIRVLIVVNTDKVQSELMHVYLRDAKKLRSDLSE